MKRQQISMQELFLYLSLSAVAFGLLAIAERMSEELGKPVLMLLAVIGSICLVGVGLSVRTGGKHFVGVGAFAATVLTIMLVVIAYAASTS